MSCLILRLSQYPSFSDASLLTKLILQSIRQELLVCRYHSRKENPCQVIHKPDDPIYVLDQRRVGICRGGSATGDTELNNIRSLVFWSISYLSIVFIECWPTPGRSSILSVQLLPTLNLCQAPIVIGVCYLHNRCEKMRGC